MDPSCNGSSTERAFFFECGRSRLFGVLHGVPSGHADIGVVFCHPFAEERALAHHVLTECARSLAGSDLPALRFDYRGCGESEGEFAETTIASRLTDIHRAIEVFSEQTGVERVCLLGLRFGAALAALIARENPLVAGVVMWEPVVRPQNYIRQFLRQQVLMENRLLGKLTTLDDLIQRFQEGQCVDVLGYVVNPTCFEEFDGIDLLTAISELQKPVLVVGISRRNRERRDWKPLLDALERGSVPTQIAQFDASHFWIDPEDTWREWRSWLDHEPMFAHTIDWVEQLSGVTR